MQQQQVRYIKANVLKTSYYLILSGNMGYRQSHYYLMITKAYFKGASGHWVFQNKALANKGCRLKNKTTTPLINLTRKLAYTLYLKKRYEKH